MMLDYNFETPATVVVVPDRRGAARTRIARTGLTLAGAVRYVVEQMAEDERARAVIRTPTRSLFIDEIAALYNQAQLASASPEASLGQQTSSEPEGGAAGRSARSEEQQDWRAIPAFIRAVSGTTTVRLAAAGMIALGCLATAGLVANYCRTPDLKPRPTEIAALIEHPSKPVTETSTNSEPNAGSAGEHREEPAALQAVDELLSVTSKLAGEAAIPAARARKDAQHHASSRMPKSNRYPSMRIGARYVMLDPVAGRRD